MLRFRQRHLANRGTYGPLSIERRNPVHQRLQTGKRLSGPLRQFIVGNVLEVVLIRNDQALLEMPVTRQDLNRPAKPI